MLEAYRAPSSPPCSPPLSTYHGTTRVSLAGGVRDCYHEPYLPEATHGPKAATRESRSFPSPSSAPIALAPVERHISPSAAQPLQPSPPPSPPSHASVSRSVREIPYGRYSPSVWGGLTLDESAVEPVAPQPAGPKYDDDVVSGPGSVQTQAPPPPEQEAQECTYCSSFGVGYEHLTSCSCCGKTNVGFYCGTCTSLGPEQK